jgi:hypothetical protein
MAAAKLAEVHFTQAKPGRVSPGHCERSEAIQAFDGIGLFWIATALRASR